MARFHIPASRADHPLAAVRQVEIGHDSNSTTPSMAFKRRPIKRLLRLIKHAVMRFRSTKLADA